MKFSDNVGDPQASYFPIPLPDCLRHVLFRRYSPLSLEVVEKRTNAKVPPPNFLRKTTPTFLQQIFSTVWQSLVEFSLLISVCEACQRIRMQNSRIQGWQ